MHSIILRLPPLSLLRSPSPTHLSYFMSSILFKSPKCTWCGSIPWILSNPLINTCFQKFDSPSPSVQPHTSRLLVGICMGWDYKGHVYDMAMAVGLRVQFSCCRLKTQFPYIHSQLWLLNLSSS